MSVTWGLEVVSHARPATRLHKGETQRNRDEERRLPGGMRPQQETHIMDLMSGEWWRLARIKRHSSAGLVLAPGPGGSQCVGLSRAPEGNSHTWAMPTKCQLPPPSLCQLKCLHAFLNTLQCTPGQSQKRDEHWESSWTVIGIRLRKTLKTRQTSLALSLETMRSHWRLMSKEECVMGRAKKGERARHCRQQALKVAENPRESSTVYLLWSVMFMGEIPTTTTSWRVWSSLTKL